MLIKIQSYYTLYMYISKYNILWHNYRVQSRCTLVSCETIMIFFSKPAIMLKNKF